jgi:ureidoglycolate dehydrogenase (NAD+)
VPRYLELFDTGEANRAPKMAESRPRPAMALLDADFAPGAVAMSRAVDLAAEIARTEGVGWVQVKHTVHAGAVGAYAERAALAGMIGIVILAGMPNMAWPGVRGAAVATSPIAIGVPSSSGSPFLLDMATAMIALGKIKQYELRGEPLPADSAVTAEGEPTTDAALAKMPLPLGGIKGAGLSLGFELLTSVLAGVPIVAPVHGKLPGAKRHRQNAAVIVVDPTAHGGSGAFETAVADTLASIRSLPPLSEGSAVGVPGDRGDATAAERRKGGIPLPQKAVDELNALAEAKGLPPLATLG